MNSVVPVIGLKAVNSEELRALSWRLAELREPDLWVQIISKWEVLAEEGVSEVVDAFHDSGVNLASIKFEFTDNFDVEEFERILLMADESAGRTVIVRPGEGVIAYLEEIHDISAIYKVKVLLEPGSVKACRKVYEGIEGMIGGVIGLSLVEEDFSDTESFMANLKKYLRITRNLNISNYEGDKPAPALIPSQYNNPRLLRFLVSSGYEGFLTLHYGRASVSDAWLLRELLSLREQLASLEEKQP